MAGSEPTNLVEATGGVRVQHNVAGRNEPPKGQDAPAMCVTLNDQTSHWLSLIHRGTLNESTTVGVKTGRPQVGGPDLWIVS